ncbi:MULTISPECIES: pilus assembly protein TadG-related protein [Micrococcaceae]|uniref:pilus assembly protein TadG-related protein n=2 Tax=Micrococcaceae TaxID=1268 RepID=UPI000A6DBCCB|nr:MULTISPECIES: pilus assembly protein TadG-related protein [Micrococcaceae]
MTPRAEEGQITVMVVGYLAVALLVATVMLGITSVYLEHKRLLSLADGAALAAADSFTLGEVAAQSGSPAALLDPGRVRSAATDFVAGSPAALRFDSLAVAGETGTRDGATAVVVLTAAVHPPIVNFLVPGGIPIEARSTARSRLTR